VEERGREGETYRKEMLATTCRAKNFFGHGTMHGRANVLATVFRVMIRGQDRWKEATHKRDAEQEGHGGEERKARVRPVEPPFAQKDINPAPDEDF
jgi:hypothetical protein